MTIIFSSLSQRKKKSTVYISFSECSISPLFLCIMSLFVLCCFLLRTLLPFSKMVIAIIKEQSLYICISQILFHLNRESFDSLIISCCIHHSSFFLSSPFFFSQLVHLSTRALIWLFMAAVIFLFYASDYHLQLLLRLPSGFYSYKLSIKLNSYLQLFYIYQNK